MSLFPNPFTGGQSGRWRPWSPSLNFIADIDLSAEEKHRSGFAGFVGSLLLFMAFFAMAWASLDETTSVRQVMAYSFILLGGLGLSLGFGFRLSQRAELKSELTSVMLGVTTGIVVLVSMMALMLIGINFTTNENVAFALLAPVAETMAFVVAPYHLFKYNFPEAHWLTMAIPADIIFSVFHFYRYFARPDFIIIWIILVIGNTFFVYIYHITKNATAPMIAHFIVNLASNTEPVIGFLVTTMPLFVGMFIVFAFVYYIIGGMTRK
jgi:hypothetical protein